MPEANAAVTESAPNSEDTKINFWRKPKVWLFIVATIALLSPFLFMRLPSNGLLLNGKPIALEVVRSDAALEKGLSGRAGMARDHGMLFVFDHPGEQCFWMKDMQFSLDMVWLDAQQKIVKIEQNIRPETYPKSFCAGNTQYVIELNAGVAKAADLHIGKTLNIK